MKGLPVKCRYFILIFLRISKGCTYKPNEAECVVNLKCTLNSTLHNIIGDELLLNFGAKFQR